MLDWLVIGGVILVLGILADDWLATRPRRPLSHMKPDGKKVKVGLGMEEMDLTRANAAIVRREEQLKDRKDNTK